MSLVDGKCRRIDCENDADFDIVIHFRFLGLPECAEVEIEDQAVCMDHRADPESADANKLLLAQDESGTTILEEIQRDLRSIGKPPMDAASAAVIFRAARGGHA